jgi:hypothetical protein
MHYANGRPAKNGDRVVLVSSYGALVVGILYDATPGNDFCNGKIAAMSQFDACPNLKEVLHWDDFKAGIGKDLSAVPDTSKPLDPA